MKSVWNFLQTESAVFQLYIFSVFPKDNPLFRIFKSFLYVQILKLEFLTFDVEYHPDCFYDRLTIVDGDGVATPTVNKMLCGSGLLDTFMSSESSLVLKFISDHVVQKTGFKANISGMSIGKDCFH